MQLLREMVKDSRKIDPTKVVDHFEDEVRPGEKVLLEMDNDLIQLYGLNLHYSKLGDQAKAQDGIATGGQVKQKAYRYYTLAVLAKEVFWMEVQLRCNIPAVCELTICKGWKIVARSLPTPSVSHVGNA